MLALHHLLPAQAVEDQHHDLVCPLKPLGKPVGRIIGILNENVRDVGRACTFVIREKRGIARLLDQR